MPGFAEQKLKISWIVQKPLLIDVCVKFRDGGAYLLEGGVSKVICFCTHQAFMVYKSICFYTLLQLMGQTVILLYNIWPHGSSSHVFWYNFLGLVIASVIILSTFLGALGMFLCIRWPHDGTCE